ncbi:unnamed protein product [Rotaria sordida]|uniref:3'(2'),5'-bisphosphate nucleotidase n=1 Tax=Rotaria sordida TaxID=392033 RepID=A0A814LGW8_9BILA|nr:unnamed protein product [Rotaria sordida]CAF1064100.1 unnamed protein product [Rotaria sordida]CAF1130603.1 unnamed protein product [Rotaria sordida]CAF1377024.1 unnamed protein product [Rotaria sordida]CAF3634641.1 unnamed protein product [Rotaria sordida]
MSYDKELSVALQACLQAARLCERVRSTIPEAIEKVDRSPVTLADFGSQALICHRIHNEFPDDPIVAEENPKELVKPERADSLKQIVNYVKEENNDVDEKKIVEWIEYGNGHVGQRFWTLDPIDGTKGFIRRDQYAIALALIVDGDVKVGVLACPAYGNDGGLMFYAVRGKGAYSQSIKSFGTTIPTRIYVVTNDNINNFRFAESVESSHGDQAKQNEIARRIGIQTSPIRMDSQVKYGLVACGQAALYIRFPNPHNLNYRENIWDHAAGAIIVEEAGGKVTDMNGKILNFRDNEKMLDNRGIIVSNGIIHEQILEALKD